LIQSGKFGFLLPEGKALLLCDWPHEKLYNLIKNDRQALSFIQKERVDFKRIKYFEPVHA